VLILDSSTLFGNTATQDGGGIFNDGTLTVINSTFYDNTAVGQNDAFGGGGIFNWYRGMLTLSNSTISHNFGTPYGGGIFNYFGGSAISTTPLKFMPTFFCMCSTSRLARVVQ